MGGKTTFDELVAINLSHEESVLPTDIPSHRKEPIRFLHVASRLPEFPERLQPLLHEAYTNIQQASIDTLLNTPSVETLSQKRDELKALFRSDDILKTLHHLRTWVRNIETDVETYTTGRGKTIIEKAQLLLEKYKDHLTSPEKSSSVFTDEQRETYDTAYEELFYARVRTERAARCTQNGTANDMRGILNDKDIRLPVKLAMLRSWWRKREHSQRGHLTSDVAGFIARMTKTSYERACAQVKREKRLPPYQPGEVRVTFEQPTSGMFRLHTEGVAYELDDEGSALHPIRAAMQEVSEIKSPPQEQKTLPFVNLPDQVISIKPIKTDGTTALDLESGEIDLGYIPKRKATSPEGVTLRESWSTTPLYRQMKKGKQRKGTRNVTFSGGHGLYRKSGKEIIQDPEVRLEEKVFVQSSLVQAYPTIAETVVAARSVNLEQHVEEVHYTKKPSRVRKFTLLGAALLTAAAVVAFGWLYSRYNSSREQTQPENIAEINQLQENMDETLESLTYASLVPVNEATTDPRTLDNEAEEVNQQSVTTPQEYFEEGTDVRYFPHNSVEGETAQSYTHLAEQLEELRSSYGAENISEFMATRNGSVEFYIQASSDPRGSRRANQQLSHHRAQQTVQEIAEFCSEQNIPYTVETIAVGESLSNQQFQEIIGDREQLRTFRSHLEGRKLARFDRLVQHYDTAVARGRSVRTQERILGRILRGMDTHPTMQHMRRAEIDFRINYSVAEM